MIKTKNIKIMESTKPETIAVHQDIFQKVAKEDRVALIYHLQAKDGAAYNNWLRKSNELLERMDGTRLFNMSVDPVPREGMLIDEIIIEEYPSSEVALKFINATHVELTNTCNNLTVLAIQPDPRFKLRIIRIIAWLMHFFMGIKDSGIPTAEWKATNTSVWPDEQQMVVARQQDLDSPLLVYNLNKNRNVAQYHDSPSASKPSSGEEAYERYSKIAGVQLLRRGAYPVYGGQPLGTLIGDDNMLNDNWSKFILVYYPERRNLLSMIEGDEFKRGQHHRDAGLERVAIFMGNYK